MNEKRKRALTLEALEHYRQSFAVNANLHVKYSADDPMFVNARKTYSELTVLIGELQAKDQEAPTEPWYAKLGYKQAAFDLEGVDDGA